MAEDKTPKGCIFDIQRYSIHDGLGIRTTVFFKGCSLRCFWCQNPESQAMEPQMFLFSERCGQCGCCIEICPGKGIRLTEAASEIDRDKCIACGKCAEVCLNEARKLTGMWMSADEVMREVVKDVSYYQNTGGGVTLSGGEPLLQPEFAVEILKKCKDLGINTALETCGQVPWRVLEEALAYTDFVLYDIKQMDAAKHKSGTGSSNELILENARKVAALKPMRVRVPLIPGFNSFREDVEAIARFVKTELPSVAIDLLAYNKMGESKYARLGREPVSLTIQDESLIQELKKIAASLS